MRRCLAAALRAASHPPLRPPPPPPSPWAPATRARWLDIFLTDVVVIADGRSGATPLNIEQVRSNFRVRYDGRVVMACQALVVDNTNLLAFAPLTELACLEGRGGLRETGRWIYNWFRSSLCDSKQSTLPTPEFLGGAMTISAGEPTPPPCLSSVQFELSCFCNASLLAVRAFKLSILWSVVGRYPSAEQQQR